ncbi:hypothetical protein [Winogradskyella forsetii]|uniref:hypothetical protein n=1 Tax=Winogradskyella forsetii TaxID=2686077 RepID=UPI0015BC02ED|nr:hypothetical protein [Winogradskyella forsetii]
MKTLQILLVILTILMAKPLMAQTPKDSLQEDSTKIEKDNFLDMGAGSLTNLFGENLDGKPNGKKLSFLELIAKMDLTEEQKVEYKNLYYLQAKDLSEKQKDSLGKAIEKK